MDIHEYQAKDILARFGVPSPRGGLAYSPEQAAYRAREIGGNRWIVKAQVHTGGRGKAGGVKLCSSEDEVEVRQAAGHPADRGGRQGRLPPLCGSSRRHQT
jgi:succinyl-CoA synthetase beta subunit